MEKTVATIEARMTSSRLPGKVLLEAGGITMTEHLVRRLKKVKSIDQIVLATTTNEDDIPLVQLAKKLDISIFRGSEENVLERVIGAARSVNASVIVQITGDCPIIDPEIVEQCIQMFKVNEVDYISNVIFRSYPDGMDTQVYRLTTLEKSAMMTTDALDREHVSLHIRNNPEIFSHMHLVAPTEIFWPELRLTLDESKDFELIKKIINYFVNKNNLYFSCTDVVRLLRKHPNYVDIN